MTAQTMSKQSVWGVLLLGMGLLFLVNQLVPGFALSRILTHLISAATFGVMAAITYTVYTQNRHKRWLAILAYALAVLTGIIALDQLLPRAHDLQGAFVTLAIAAPFLYVYAKDRRQWWALIPGGVMGLVGVGLLLDAMSGLLPLILIGGGVLLLLAGMQRRGDAVSATTVDAPLPEMMPISGPQADRPRE